MAIRLVALLLLATTCWAGEKTYQTATLLDVTRHTETHGGFIAGGTGTTSETFTVWEITVSLDNTVIVGTYYPRMWFYEPTDMVANAPVQVRVDKNKLIILRPDGKELKTKIIKRVAK